VVQQRTLCQTVKLPGLYAGLELPVPNLGVKLREPLTERRQFFRRKLLDLAFDLLPPAHGGLAGVSISALQRRMARWAQTDTRRLKPPGWMIPSFGADRAVAPERRIWTGTGVRPDRQPCDEMAVGPH